MTRGEHKARRLRGVQRVRAVRYEYPSKSPGCANGICRNEAYREGQSCGGGDGECANGICQLDHVLRIFNDLNSLDVKGEKNAVVRVRIGSYSSDCSYLVNDASTERLNRRDSWPASSVENTNRISPGSTGGVGDIFPAVRESAPGSEVVDTTLHLVRPTGPRLSPFSRRQSTVASMHNCRSPPRQLCTVLHSASI